MADHKTGMLDDIGPDDDATPTPEAPEIEAGAPEAPETEQDAGAEGERQRKPDNRPEGYVTKAERDRVARERDEYRQRAAVLEERTQKIIDRFFKQDEPENAGQPEMDLGPDPKDDPVGALEWHREQKRLEIEQRRQNDQQTAQQQQAQRQWQEAYTAAQVQFETAKTDEPALQGLYDGLRKSYAKEYEALGYPLPQIGDLVQRQEAQIIQWAHANRIPIGQAIKSLAQSRGVQGQAPQQTEQQQEQQPRDPETGQFQPADAEKAARQRESQERNASLSSAPGAPVKKMTAKELASMPEDEMWRMFENVGRKAGSKQFDREMGFR